MKNQNLDQNQIILYSPNESISLEVRLENETVWLNRQQIAQLFGRDIKTIGKHINNALKEELANFLVVANFATTEQLDNSSRNASCITLILFLVSLYDFTLKRVAHPK